MNIELRNIQVNARLSEETTCFSAVVYVDGKKAFDAGNHGHGGPNFYHDRYNPGGPYEGSTIDRAEKWAKGLPPIEAFGTTLSMDLDLYIGELLVALQRERDVKRALASKVVFRLGPKLMQCPGKTPAQQQSAKEYISRKHPEAKILNGLPLAEAIALYFEDKAAA